MFPSSCQQLPTIQRNPIRSAIFFRIFGGCSMLMVRNAATGEPTSPTVSTGLRTVSALPISPRNCRSYRKRTRIGSWVVPLSRDSIGPQHDLPAAEMGPDPSGGWVGLGYHRCCSPRSGAGSASRRMGAHRQRISRTRRDRRHSTWYRRRGALEAADLVQSGIATRVAVFADPPSGEDHEFIRRGLPYEDAAARQIDQLKWLGVTDVVPVPR